MWPWEIAMLGAPIVFLAIFLLFRSRRDASDPRSLAASSGLINAKVEELLQAMPEDLRGASGQDLGAAQKPAPGADLANAESLVPEGAKRVYDLKDLPPELAANPEIQKLLEKAGSRAWVKVTRRGKSDNSGFAGAEPGPEAVKISVSVKRAGQPMRMSTTEKMSELPSGLDPGDPQQLARWVKSQEMLSSDTLGSAKAFRRLIIVGAVIGVLGVCLWALYFSK